MRLRRTVSLLLSFCILAVLVSMPAKALESHTPEELTAISVPSSESSSQAPPFFSQPNEQLPQLPSIPAVLPESSLPETSLPEESSEQTTTSEESDITQYEESTNSNEHSSHKDQQTSSESASQNTESLPAEFGSSMWNEDLAVTVSLACDWINSEQGSLYFLCMGTAGKPAVSNIVNQYIVDVSLKDEYDAVIDLSYDILNATFSGYNATNVLGKNLIDLLARYPDYASMDLYSVAYGLLALDSNPYQVSSILKNNRESLKQLLLHFQNPDGGFFSYQTGPSSVIQTGLALTALAPYQEEPQVATAIEMGVNYLSQQQYYDGSYVDDSGQESSIAISKVIVALNTLGISLDDPRFVKNDKTLVTLLLDYVNIDSGFSSHLNSASDVLATENAILALVSLKKHGSPYVMDSSLKEVSSKQPQNILLEDKSQIDWPSISLYILLAAAALALLASIVLIKLHPIRRSRFYLEHHPEQLEKQEEIEITISSSPVNSELEETDSSTTDQEKSEQTKNPQNTK